MERLGLGYDDLHARNPRLIYVSISGVGDTGPYVKKRVYDPIVRGEAGEDLCGHFLKDYQPSPW